MYSHINLRTDKLIVVKTYVSIDENTTISQIDYFINALKEILKAQKGE